METEKVLSDVKKRGVGGAQKVKGKGAVAPLTFKSKTGKKESYKGGFGGHY